MPRSPTPQVTSRRPAGENSFAVPSIGLIRVRDHCLFTWREQEFNRRTRTIELTPEHCEECIQEIRNLSSEALQPVEVVDLRALAAKLESD